MVWCDGCGEQVNNHSETYIELNEFDYTKEGWDMYGNYNYCVTCAKKVRGVLEELNETLSEEANQCK